jgi:hypothetical protein
MRLLLSPWFKQRELHMQMTGGCLCGSLRYSVSAAPVFQVICHCKMCQKASGGPFVALAFVPPESVAVTKGTTKTIQTSSDSVRHFCADCGSPIFFQRPQVQRIAVLVGTLDEPFDFKPNFHCYTESTMTWLKNLDDDTPRFETWSEDAGMVPPTDYNPKQGLNR